jgi:SAM-dependent methyltransferase
MDILPSVEPDIVSDITRPWPLADGSCSAVIMSHVLEHVEEPFEVLAEAARVVEDNGLIEITVPFGANWLIDPTHKTHWSWTTLEYFAVGHERRYFDSSLHLLSRQVRDLHVLAPFELLTWPLRLLVIDVLPVGDWLMTLPLVSGEIHAVFVVRD